MTTPLNESPHWRRNFYLFLTGQFLSGITSMVVQYVLIWYLSMATKSTTVLSVAAIVGMLPMVLLSPFVGGLIDRTNKRALLIGTDAVVALFALILSVVGGFTATFPMWLVFVSLFIRAVAQTFQYPTLQSALPAMVPADQLTQRNGQFSMLQSATYIISPGLATMVFSLAPLHILILLDVVGFLIGTGLLLLVTIPRADVTDTEPVRPIADAVYGWRALKTRRGLLLLTLVGTVFTLFYMPVSSMYPLMTVNFFGLTVDEAGIVEVVWAAGMLVGGLIISAIKHWSNRMRPVIMSLVVVGLGIGGAILLPQNRTGFWLFVAMNAVAGIAAPFFSTMFMTMVQESFDPAELGRVIGVITSLMSLSGPIGLIGAGPLGDAVGVQYLFLIGGIGALLCAAVVVLNRTIRGYDRALTAEAGENPPE